MFLSLLCRPLSVRSLLLLQQPGRTAADGTGQNGIDTKAFLKHLQTPGSPWPTSFLKVWQEVMQKTKNEQIPWESTSLTDHFYFQR